MANGEGDQPCLIVFAHSLDQVQPGVCGDSLIQSQLTLSHFQCACVTLKIIGGDTYCYPWQQAANKNTSGADPELPLGGFY